jgi:hypothetical protein
MACDVRSLFTRLAEVFMTAGLDEGECRKLIDAMFEEFEDLHTTISSRVAIGCRSR